MKPSDPDSPENAVLNFEAELGLTRGFFFSLLNEDDWSFVIKLHALMEAAVSHLLSMECGRPELVPVFSRVELSNNQSGKLGFAKALGCLDDIDRKFIRQLSELRNDFVHDVRNAGATLAQHVARLDANGFRNFRAAFGPGTDPFVVGGHSMPEAEYVRQNPKLTIWINGMFVIAAAYHRKALAESKADFAASVSKILRGVHTHEESGDAGA